MESITTHLCADVEHWLPIVGYPYEVSDHGRVRRVGRPGRGVRLGRILKPTTMKVGYQRVWLGHDHHAYVHHLVAEAFLGPRPYRMVVHHVDGDRVHNCASNLVYVTQRQNLDRDGRRGQYPAGERHPNAKLREVDVRAIKACLAAGKDNADIARFFHVRPETVDKIWRGERWAAVAL